jgi:serine/threonine protein kinase
MSHGIITEADLVDDLDGFDSHVLETGTQLGRYELLVPVARGGMARVWAARLRGDRGFSKLVAVKTILPELARDPLFERMFLEEAKIAAAVHHPNACEVYELGEHQGVLYLAMEWVKGDTLARLLHKVARTATRVDPVTAARIVADACAGLHAVHELPDELGAPLHVVHRDVSPQNILVTRDGIAKIADFGIAKAHAGYQQELTVVGQLKGKRSYMSPEYVCGESLDRRADVFSMGATLYEATTGCLPFQGPNELMMLQALVDGELLPPSRAVPDYPPGLEEIVLRAMASEREDRYQTADALRMALEDWLAQSVGPRARRSVARVIEDRVGEDIDARERQIRKAIGSLSDLRASGELRSLVMNATGEHAVAPVAPESDPNAETRISPIPPLPVAAAVIDVQSAPREPAPTVKKRMRRSGRWPFVATAVGACFAVFAGGIGGYAALRMSSPAGEARAAMPPKTSDPVAPKQNAKPPEPRVTTPMDLPSAPPVRGHLDPRSPTAHVAPPPVARAVAPASAPRAPAKSATPRPADELMPDNPYAKGPR